MGRFSDFVASKASELKQESTAPESKKISPVQVVNAPAPAERQEPFLVDNRALGSRSKGITYRRSMFLKDRTKRRLRWNPLELTGKRAEEAANISEGTKLVVKEESVQVFMTVESRETVGRLQMGQVVVAAGQPRQFEGYTMLPIAQGAVQLRLLELEHEYFKRRPGVAQFGTIIRGVKINDDWVQVGTYYLPTHVGGRQVLQPAWWEDLEDEEQKEKERQHNINLAAWIQKRDKEAEAKAEMERLWGDLTAFDTSSLTPGSGTLYEVVSERAVIRAQPELEATMQNFKEEGATIELFEWDRTWKWRRCLDVDVCSKKGAPLVRITGWMLIDHPDVGPLLRPRGFPTAAWAWMPLRPIIAAVWENNVALLQHLLADSEQTTFPDHEKRILLGAPSLLSIAVARGHLDSVVILYDAGQCHNATDSSDTLQVEDPNLTKLALALIAGFDGDQDVATQDVEQAVEMLNEETQAIAERLLEEKVQSELQSEPQPEPDEISEDEMPEETEAQAVEIYEVLISAVWIRAEPNPDAPKMTIRKKGERVRLYDWDKTGNWRRTKTGGADSRAEMLERVGEGWMMLSHPSLGSLLQRVETQLQ